MRRVLWFCAGLLAVVAVGAVWLGVALVPDAPEMTVVTGGLDAADRPEPAPEISFSDAAGNRLTLIDFRGRVVLLNLWATWCAPCVEEMPSLDRLQARLGGEDFQVLPLSIDREGLDAVQPFYGELGLDHLGVYLDPMGAAPRAFGAVGLPASYLIDRDGRVVAALAGAREWDTDASIAELRRYIDG